MPTATKCIMNGNTIDICEALILRDQADKKSVNREDYFCIECDQPIFAHRASDSTAAHFEHRKRNLDCSLSPEQNTRRG